MQKMRYLEGLTKHYTFIDTPKPIRLVANPFKTSQGWSGTDSAFLPAGAWRIDNWTLLLTKDFPNSPAFKLAIVWDDELLDIDKVTIEFHDVNFGEGVAGVAGQAVVVNGFSSSALGHIEDVITKIGDTNTLLSDSNTYLEDILARSLSFAQNQRIYDYFDLCYIRDFGNISPDSLVSYSHYYIREFGSAPITLTAFARCSYSSSGVNLTLTSGDVLTCSNPTSANISVNGQSYTGGGLISGIWSQL